VVAEVARGSRAPESGVSRRRGAQARVRNVPSRRRGARSAAVEARVRRAGMSAGAAAGSAASRVRAEARFLEVLSVRAGSASRNARLLPSAAQSFFMESVPEWGGPSVTKRVQRRTEQEDTNVEEESAR